MNALAKWGNSLAIRIPAKLAEESGLKEGAQVHITAKAGKLIVKKARPKFKLKDLLAEITPDNRHSEVDWGASVGKEEW